MQEATSVSFHVIVSKDPNGKVRIYNKECNADLYVEEHRVSKELAGLVKFWWAAQEIQS